MSMFPVHNFSHDFNHDLSRVSLVCEFVMISSAAPSSKRRELVGQSPMVHEVRQCDDDDDDTCDIFPGHDNSCCHERKNEGERRGTAPLTVTAQPAQVHERARKGRRAQLNLGLGLREETKI